MRECSGEYDPTDREARFENENGFTGMGVLFSEGGM